MAYRHNRRNHVCFVDFMRASWPEPYDYSYKPSHFVADNIDCLPVMMKVTDGYYGTNSINFTHSSEDIYLITHIKSQKRIIIKDRTGQLLSLPDDHEMPFYAVVDEKEESETMLLGQIVDKYAMSASKVQVKPMPGKSINFCHGAGSEHSMVMDKFEFEAVYEERYLVGNSIAHENMGTTPVVIPIWMPISVTAALGFKDGTMEDYRKFMNEMKIATKDFANSKATGVKEIMLFEGKLSDYAEGTYDTIAPFDYGSIKQFQRPKPELPGNDVAPPLMPRKPSLSDSGTSPINKPAIELPSQAKSKKSGFKSIFKKSKSSDCNSEYEKSKRNQQTDQAHMYTSLEKGNSEQTSNVYSVASDTAVGLPQRPLPRLPPEENRITRTKSCTESKPSTKSPTAKYESVHVDTSLPVYATSNDDPRKSESKLPPPMPEEGSLYGDYMDLPQSLEGMSVKEVAETLHILKMSRHVERFKEEDVDGSLLNSLTKDILMEDFQFTQFEVTKLMKFKRGWRPKKDDSAPKTD